MKLHGTFFHIVYSMLVVLILWACGDTIRPPILKPFVNHPDLSKAGWDLVSETHRKGRYTLSFRNKTANIRSQIVVELNKAIDNTLEYHLTEINASYSLICSTRIKGIKCKFLSEDAYVTSAIYEQEQTHIVVYTLIDQGLPVSIAAFSHWNDIPDKTELESLYQMIRASSEQM